MRVINYKSGTIQRASAEYNTLIRRRNSDRKRRLLWRVVLILCVLSCISGFINGLTGLNSQASVVSAHEPTIEFNPVKNKKVVVIVIVSDQEEAKELLKKLGVDNVRQNQE